MPQHARAARGAGTAVALVGAVESRSGPPSQVHWLRPAPPDDGVLASPVPSMLELSAATRAVAAETELSPAVAVLQRVARSLTRSRDAMVVIYDWSNHAAWTLDAAVISTELGERAARVAAHAQREVLGHALLEPIGAAPVRAVLILQRFATDRFSPDDITLVCALVGGIAATVSRLVVSARR
jgi:hypothetical protein